MIFRSHRHVCGSIVATVARVLCLLLVAMLCLPGLAQSTSGRVLGTVSDQSGAAVAGATVMVTDAERGTSRTLTTDPPGAYAAPDLTPGTYKIHVEAKGFKSSNGPMCVIEVATDVRADFTLQPGEVSETVVVRKRFPSSTPLPPLWAEHSAIRKSTTCR